jgi:hypothetical protein
MWIYFRKGTANRNKKSSSTFGRLIAELRLLDQFSSNYAKATEEVMSTSMSMSTFTRRTTRTTQQHPSTAKCAMQVVPLHYYPNPSPTPSCQSRPSPSPVPVPVPPSPSPSPGFNLNHQKFVRAVLSMINLTSSGLCLRL